MKISETVHLLSRKIQNLTDYVADHWGLVVGSAIAISGAIALLRNLYHIINLRLQNKKLAKEVKRDEATSTTSEDEHPRYEEAISDLNIVYADVARNSLAVLNLSENKFLDLISIEFKSHPLFSQIDYESLPLPLKNGYFAVLTKVGKKITLETISKTAVKKELFDAWSHMARLYFQAYRLPFRSNHNILTREKEFERSFKLLSELIVAAQKYILQTQIVDDENVRMACHALKQRAAHASAKAEFAYLKYKDSNDSSLLGDVAIHFDLIVSAIHKILIEYNVPK